MTVANLFTEMVVKHHYFPLSIVFDKDPIFFSKFWQDLFQLSWIVLKYSTAYHSQTDGQTEVLNRCLEQYLRAFTHQHPQSWTKFLLWAALWYNTSFHSAIGMTPFEALYGKPPWAIQTYVQGSSFTKVVDSDLVIWEEVLAQLK